MNVDIRLPNIDASAPEASQLMQIRSYLYQFAGQLQWALNNVENTKNGNSSPAVIFEQNNDISQEDAENTFNSIKALIIKSADIVRAYEETIKANFNGTYFAGSDFGQYIEETNAAIVANSKGVTETYKSIQKITNDEGTGSLDVLEEESRVTNAYIKRGLLGYDDSGNAIYGVEVGETSDNGAFVKYARFKADRLSFYDENGSEIAYIGAGCLYIIGKSVFLGEIQLGGYKSDTSDGLAFTWIGG